jgi:hypothetical protein
MERMRREAGGICSEDGSVVLERETARHLLSALEQMDLLLQTQEIDVALGHLVGMLGHLRVVASGLR